MHLRKVTFWLSVLFAIAIPAWATVSEFVMHGDFNLLFVLELFLFFSLPYMVTALIAIPMKKTASLVVLLCHTLGFIAATGFLFFLATLGKGPSAGQGGFLLMLVPLTAVFISPFFGLAAIITEIVLRYKDKNKVPEA